MKCFHEWETTTPYGPVNHRCAKTKNHGFDEVPVRHVCHCGSHLDRVHPQHSGDSERENT